MAASPDAVSSREGLHDEVSRATVPGAPLLGLLVEGSDVGGLADGGKHGEGSCASALHTQVPEEIAGPAGLHGLRQHGIHLLVHPTPHPCTHALPT